MAFNTAHLLRLTAQFVRARGGNVAMMFGLFLIPLLIAAGMAVDYSRAAQARAVVQEAADGALLRVARMKSLNPGLTDADLTAAARQIFNAGTSRLADIAIDDFAVFYDSENDKFRLTVASDLSTSLLRVIGLPTLGVNAASEVKLGKPPYLEVVMALDNTGSMNDSGKLQSLKDSATLLVESLFEHPDADVLVGLVPFAQYVNVGVANKTAAWMGASGAAWEGCVGSRNFPANTEDADYAANPVPAVDGALCPQKIFPLSDNKADMLAAINAMTANGYTYIAAGAAWGWRALTDRAPFTEGISYADLEARDGSKVLIVLTDGENTRGPTYPAHNSTDRTLADDITLQTCQAAKDEGVVIYTIAFDVTAPLVRTMLETCGTTPGHYFEAANASELGDAFEEIALSLRHLSLSK